MGIPVARGRFGGLGHLLPQGLRRRQEALQAQQPRERQGAHADPGLGEAGTQGRKPHRDAAGHHGLGDAHQGPDLSLREALQEVQYDCHPLLFVDADQGPRQCLAGLAFREGG
jgi:hypothetical protein